MVADTYFGMREELAGQLEICAAWRQQDFIAKVDLFIFRKVPLWTIIWIFSGGSDAKEPWQEVWGINNNVTVTVKCSLAFEDIQKLREQIDSGLL